jgi:Aldo/keto reductase family/ABC transporter substrate binding protein
VSRNPDLIIAISNNLVFDFKAATTTIPIVGAFASRVETGIVASLARPGGNITGASVNVGSFPEQWGKRIQLLQQVMPAARLAFLQSRRMREQVGPKEGDSNWLGVTWVGPPFDHPIDEDGYRRVFAAFAQDRAEAVAVAEENEREEREILPLCKAEGIGVIPWSPLARGRLTRDWDEKSARSEADAIGKSLYAKSADADRRVVERVAEIAMKPGVPRAQVALAWVLSKPTITAPIVGATKLHHLDDALAALSLNLSPEEISNLEQPYVPHGVVGFS